MDVVAIAQGFAAEVRERAPEIEQARRLPADLSRKLAEAGLFRMLVPAEYGGLETSPVDVARAIETLAQADASAGWCLMISATTGSLAARLAPDQARHIYGDPNVITGGVFAPMGRAVEDGDDYVVTGRWKWGSHSQNCRWIAGGAVLMDGDKPRQGAEGQPLHRMMLFSADQVEFHDTWRTAGLCGTGSLDFSVREARVPKARSVALQSDPSLVKSPAFAFPAFGLLAMGVAAVALGNARAALLTAGQQATAKSSEGSQKTLAERQTTQAEFAQAVASLSAARALFYEAVGLCWHAAQTGGAIPQDLRARLRLACTHAAKVSADISRVAYDLLGGQAVFLDSELQRRFRDANVITHHVMVAPASWELAGRVLLGLPTRDSML
jgi:alkylation response protein AidB-like acyl-CoA dehydrogenase